MKYFFIKYIIYFLLIRNKTSLLKIIHFVELAIWISVSMMFKYDKEIGLPYLYIPTLLNMDIFLNKPTMMNL